MDRVRERWNERHARRALQASAPEPWVVAHRDLLAARAAGGHALDLACGRGRNALFLATLGFTVDAVDISDVAVAAVEEAARTHRLPVTAHRLDLTRDPFPAPPYDAIVVVNYLERTLFGAIEAALRPGGLLVYETFTDAAGDMNPAFTLAGGELLTAFPALEIVDQRETGPRAALVARRPG